MFVGKYKSTQFIYIHDLNSEKILYNRKKHAIKNLDLILYNYGSIVRCIYLFYTFTSYISNLHRRNVFVNLYIFSMCKYSSSKAQFQNTASPIILETNTSKYNTVFNIVDIKHVCFSVLKIR